MRSRGLHALKVLLAALAIGLVGLVAVWPQLPAHIRLLGPVAPATDVSAAPGMSMARYVGTDDQNRPFSIRADAVRNMNMVLGGDEILLDAPEADMTLDGGAWVFVSADSGRYDLDEKSLKLRGDVRLFHDSGYELNSSEADVDLVTNEVSGNEPVDVQGPAGLISAEGFRIRNNGKSVLFTGRAKMTILNGSDGLRQ